jgi:CheY-like chemotaxis protein
MPVLDGRGFAAGLRQLGRPIPIALVTGEPNGAVLAEEIGAVAAIPKPLTFHQLLPVLETVLQVDLHT